MRSLTSFMVISVFTLLLSPSVSEASSFSSSHCFQPRSRVVEVIKEIVPVAYPVPFTVAIPVVSYLPNSYVYSPTYSAQLTQPALPVTAPGAAPNVTITLSNIQIDQIIARIESRIRSSKPAYSTPPTSPPPRVPARIGPAFSILSKNCAECHTGPDVKGDVRIFTKDNGALSLYPNVSMVQLWDAADAGRMPPKAKNDINQALTDAEVAVLRAWMLGR